MENKLIAALETAFVQHRRVTAFWQEDGTALTFENLHYTIISFAEQLLEKGVSKKENVAVFIGDPLAGLALRIAILRIGANLVSAPRQRLLDPSLEIRFVICRADEEIQHPGRVDFDQSWIRSPSRMVPIGQAGNVILSTSGTTGTPQLRSFADDGIYNRVIHGLSFRGALHGPVLIAQNMAAIVGLKASLTALISGQPQLHFRGEPEKVVAQTALFGISVAFIAPVELVRLTEAAESNDAVELRIERINVGGGKISRLLAERAERALSGEVFTDYGSTETDTIASQRIVEGPTAQGAVGRPHHPIECRVRQIEGHVGGSNGDGVLWVRIPSALNSFDFPGGESLSDKMGWINTGDIARIESDGTIVLTGRVFDLINAGGNKISTGAVESIALASGMVAEVAAFRLDTDSGIDAIGIAAIPLGADQSPLRLSDHLVEVLRGHFNISVFFSDELPRGDTGKIDRSRLATWVDSTSKKS